MKSSTAIVTTKHASKYLQQLCKHFGHKVPVEFSPEAGLIRLPFGSCDLVASDEALTITTTSEASRIEQIQKVIGDHLSRFAFREDIKLNWKPA